MIANEHGLWTLSRYTLHINPPERCSICNLPYIGVISEDLDQNQSLEEYIIEAHSLPESFLGNIDQIPGYSFEEVSIGGRDFIRMSTSEKFDFTYYYTQVENRILGFYMQAHTWEENRDELEQMISTLEFEA